METHTENQGREPGRAYNPLVAMDKQNLYQISIEQIGHSRSENFQNDLYILAVIRHVNAFVPRREKDKQENHKFPI